MTRETTSRLVRMAERLVASPHSVEDPLSANMEGLTRDLLSLMRLRLQEGGLSIPDAMHLVGERLAANFGRQGAQVRTFINATLRAQPEVYKLLLPHFSINITAPRTSSEDLLIRDLLAAKKGELSKEYIDSRIENFLFSDSKEKAA